jgi:hypothetical protein
MNQLERNRAVGEFAAARCMGTINAATAELCEALGELHANEGWGGVGIQSLEHWTTWKAGVSNYRAQNLVRIAKRIDELPTCFGLFREGRLSEDSMTRVARKVPASRDDEVANLALHSTVRQLDRILSALPDVEAPVPPMSRAGGVRLQERPDGSGKAVIELPADQWALFTGGLYRAREVEYRDKHDLDDAAEVPRTGGGVTLVDAIVRMSTEARDSLDPTFRRTGFRGEANQVVIHRDLLPDGTLGPGRLHGSLVNLPDALNRYLCCDAKVRMNVTMDGRLVGITPTERVPNRALRRHLERRDGGCAHPLCGQRRWVHQHHIVHWEDGGPTIPSNLVSLCSRCHRSLHAGDFSIEGNPETAASLVFRDKWGRAIEPPQIGPSDPSGTNEPAAFIPASGEPLRSALFSWN